MERRTGHTTRMVDAVVQKLFTEGNVKLGGDNPDFIDFDGSPKTQHYLFTRILGRLHAEHKWCNIKVNQLDLELTFEDSKYD